MELTNQRRYTVTGNGIRAHGTTLEEALSLFRQRIAVDAGASAPSLAAAECMADGITFGHEQQPAL